jgi:hypothetical protein
LVYSSPSSSGGETGDHDDEIGVLGIGSLALAGFTTVTPLGAPSWRPWKGPTLWVGSGKTRLDPIVTRVQVRGEVEGGGGVLAVFLVK